MANRADGTDGRGAPSLNKSQVSGKSSDSYGRTASRSMPSGSTVSGKVDASFGTRAAKNVGKTNVPTDANTDKGPISKSGGRF